jgi:hypothetical protein
MYLVVDSEEEAKTRSREAWEQKLGRKKNPGDVTEFLWGWDAGKDGRVALEISEKTEFLTQAETLVAISDLPDGKDENWEKIDPTKVAAVNTLG